MVKPINDSINFGYIESEKKTTHLKLAMNTVTNSQDDVNLSYSSKKMEMLKEIIHSVSAIKQARVQYFKEIISAGNYEVDPSIIAKNMIADIV